ncbi:hypothetical protein Tco_0013416 [Tanacetum coccineum]
MCASASIMVNLTHHRTLIVLALDVVAQTTGKTLVAPYLCELYQTSLKEKEKEVNLVNQVDFGNNDLDTIDFFSGDVFTGHFANCHFNEAIFPLLGAEKKSHEKDVSWSEPSLLYLDPRTKQNIKSDDKVTQEFKARLKRGRPVGSKNKNPRKRKAIENTIIHEDIKTTSELVIIDVYVDDLNIVGTNKEINEVVVHLKEEFEMKDLGGILRRLEAFVASPIGCGGSDVRIA